MTTSLHQAHRIFISHSSKDNDFGLKLVHDLRQALGDENAVWYDAKAGLHGGDTWWDKIKEELRARSVFIVVLSPDALMSPWVQDEIRIAWKQKNSQGKHIIPVLYRACTVPDDLDTLHVISFLSPRVYEDAFNELLVALGLPVGMETIGRQPDDPDARFVLQVMPQIEAAFASHNMQEVIQKADFLIKKVPGAIPSSIYHMQGLAFLEENDLPHADEALNAALALVSEKEPRLKLLDEHTHVLIALGRWNEVLRHATEALRQLPDDPDWLMIEKKALAQMGQSVPAPTPATPPINQPTIRVPMRSARSIYRSHTASVYDVIWSPDSKYIVSSSADYTVQLWEAENARQIFIYRGHSQRVNAVSWSPDGTRIASASNDKTIHVWDVATGSQIFACHGHSDWVNDVEWSHDGKLLASASNDKTVQIWDGSTGKHIFTYKGHSNWVNAAMWSPDDQRIASASSDKTAQVWSVLQLKDGTMGNLVKTYRGHTKGVNALLWSPSGVGLASASDDKTVHLWTPVADDQSFVYRNHNQPVMSLARSPHGRRIASASDKTVQVWYGATGDLIFTDHGHNDWIRVVAWSPNGRYIASAGDDKTVQVWSVVDDLSF